MTFDPVLPPAVLAAVAAVLVVLRVLSLRPAAPRCCAGPA
jgi:hypothetical protein